MKIRELVDFLSQLKIENSRIFDFWMLTKVCSKELSLNMNLLPFMLAPKSPQICPRDGDTHPHRQMTVIKATKWKMQGIDSKEIVLTIICRKLPYWAPCLRF